MESVWEMDRMRLYQLRRAHPDWSQPRLAQVLKRSVSWVKKWLKRFRETKTPSLTMFKSQSRAPHHHPRAIVKEVRDAILSLRDALTERYGRVAGPKPILYHLHQDSVLKTKSVYLPRSTTPIWKVLKEGGRIPTRVKEHHPIERPEPMQHWEMDFGQIGSELEFLSVMDRGTSIMVHTATQQHYNAETALLAVVQFLLLCGCPQKLRFDNDTRFVGSWRADKFPSPLMKLLCVLGIQPDITQPGKPQHKPVVERSVRTLKHECLWIDPPQDWIEAEDFLAIYRQFYNHERANQSLACGNRPPYEAFPQLPTLPRLPETVDPDSWLDTYHQHLFQRQVGKNGRIAVGNHGYYVDYKLARAKVAVLLDAKRRVFQVMHGGRVVCEKEIQGLVGKPIALQDYIKLMAAEARTLHS